MAKSFSVSVGDFVELPNKEVCDVLAVESTGNLDDGYRVTLQNSKGQIAVVPEVWVRILAMAKHFNNGGK